MIRCCKLIPNGLLFGDWFLEFFDLFPLLFPPTFDIGDVGCAPNIPAKAPKAFLRLRKFGKSTNKDGLCSILGFPQIPNCWESIIVISSVVSSSLECSSFQVWILQKLTNQLFHNLWTIFTPWSVFEINWSQLCYTIITVSGGSNGL